MSSFHPQRCYYKVIQYYQPLLYQEDLFTSSSAPSDPNVFKVRIVLAPCTIQGIHGKSEAEGRNLVRSLSIPIYKSFRNSALPIPLNTRTPNESLTKVISGEQYPVRITNIACLWQRSRREQFMISLVVSCVLRQCCFHNNALVVPFCPPQSSKNYLTPHKAEKIRK